MMRRCEEEDSENDGVKVSRLTPIGNDPSRRIRDFSIGKFGFLVSLSAAEELVNLTL